MTRSQPKGSNSSKQWVVALALVALVMMLLSRTQNIDLLMEQSAQTSEKTDSTTTNTVATASKDEATPQNPIRQISILGERNSGTRWTFDHMFECFGHELSVKKELVRYKHWFQYDDPSKYPHDTLVLAQFRNPYDWFKAMEHVPHHSPAHLRAATNHSWKVFLTKPWTTERVGTDLWPNRTQHPTERNCQQHFRYRDIVSCDIEPLPHSHYNHTIRYSEHQPFYEMRNDGSGEPYANLMELRTDKIRNFLSVADYEGVADLWVLQYEYLVHKGTRHLVDRVAEWTGVTPQCEAKPPQQRKPKKSRMIAPDFARHVRKHLNWTVEKWIGYEPDLKREEVNWDW